MLRCVWPFLLAVALSGAPVTIAFESSSGYRFELDLPRFLDERGERFIRIQDSTNFCFAGPDPCPSLSLLTTETVHTVVFGASIGADFPNPAMSQPGAALALPGSTFDARLVAYERHADLVYEYFFKDSTGTRTFRYQTPRMLVRDTALAGPGLRDCTAAPGSSCGPLGMDMDLAGLDALSFTEGGLPFAYFFPQLAFSTLGIHQTDGGAFSGVLTVRLVRPDLPDPPPAAVPEPAAAVLAAAGLGALLLRSTCLSTRRWRGCSPTR